MPSHHEPLDAELDRARQHTRVPIDPVALGRPDGRHQRVEHSPEEVSVSYATQRYFLVRDGARHLLAPAPTAHQAGNDAEVRHFLTAWNAGGRPHTFEENAIAQDQLRARVAQQVVGTAVAMPPEHRWFEEVLIVSGLDDDSAADLGRQFGQPAVTAWAAGKLRVIPTGSSPVVEGLEQWARLAPVSLSCPIRDDLDASGRCVPRGGPWVSASIHAHALWSDHRALGVRLLGCGPCENGRLPAWDGPGGRSIALSSVCIASRYGGASWRP
jgi:hypothetical protein